MIQKDFNLALIQLNSSDNQNENFKKIKALIEKASKNADLIILPEHSDGISKNDSDFEDNIPGKASNFFSELAKENRIFLHCGSIAEKFESGKPLNTSILFSPSGEIIAKYSKLHLFDVDLPNGKGVRESKGASAGSEIVVADTPFCKIGLSICYDLRFPELYRKMALMGADLMVVSANFTAQTGALHWNPLLQARAIENTCYIAAVNQCKANAQFEAYGHTMLIDPWGKIIAELEQDEDILYGRIEAEALNSARQSIPSLKNRRADLY